MSEKSKEFEKFIGSNVVVWCINYIYAGKLEEVGDLTIVLSNAHLIFDAGNLQGETFNQYEKIKAKEWRIFLGAVESFGCAEQADILEAERLKKELSGIDPDA